MKELGGGHSRKPAATAGSPGGGGEGEGWHSFCMDRQAGLVVGLFPSEKASKAEFYLDVQWVFKHVRPTEFTGK